MDSSLEGSQTVSEELVMAHVSYREIGPPTPGDREMRFQSLPQEQPRPMHTHLDVDDGETKDFSDLPVRESLDVTQHHDGEVIVAQPLDRRAEREPQRGLASRVVDAHRPVDDRRDVAAALIEYGQQRVERDIRAAAATPPATLIGRVGHDPIDPRAERSVSTKRIDLPDHGQEGVLHGFLGILRIPRDPRGQPVGPVTVGSHQILGGRWIPAPKGHHELAVPVDPCRYSEGYRATLEASTRRWSGGLRPYFGRVGFPLRRAPRLALGWYRADARAFCIPFLGGGVTRCCHVVPPCVSRSATRRRQPSCHAGGRDVGESKSAFYLDDRISTASAANNPAASGFRTPTEFRPDDGYRSCCRAWRSVGFSSYLSILRYSVLFEIRRSLATIVRLPWRRAIAVLMTSRSTAPRSQTAADSAWAPCSPPGAATERAISSGIAAAVTVSSLVNITMPSTTCRISRTFPGHAYRSSASMTSASNRFMDTPWRRDTSRLKCSTSSAMSSLRSRSAGMRSAVTDTR